VGSEMCIRDRINGPRAPFADVVAPHLLIQAK
jgi:hypothetical protein